MCIFLIYKTIRKCFFVFFVLLNSSVIFAQKNQTNHIILSNQKEMLLIGKKTYFLADSTGELQLRDILEADKQQKFIPINHDIFQSPASTVVYWCKFTIQNHTNQNTWLQLADGLTSSYLDFYAPDSLNKYEKPLLLGSFRAQENKLINSNYYCVPIAKANDKEVRTYYLRIESIVLKSHIFKAGTLIALHQDLKSSNYAVTAYIAVVLAMFVYNLLIFFSTKERIYLVYISYLAYIVVAIPFGAGYPLFYGNWLWEYMFAWSALGYIISTVFATLYLEMHKNAFRFYIWMLFLTFILGLVLPLFNLFQVLDIITILPSHQFISFLYNISLLSVAIYLWVKGQKNARFYVLAWAFVFITVLVYILTTIGLLPVTKLFTYTLYIGFGLEALLFGLALGDKLTTLKRDKELAQIKNLKLVQEQNDILAKKVKEKTKNLQDSNDELQAINEELLQFQDEMKKQKDLLERTNYDLSRHKSQVSKSIESAQLIQNAILPTLKKIKEQFEDYFILYLPKDVVSGDFYWMDVTPEHTIFIEADCTGHGVSGAFMSLIGHTIFDQIIRVDRIYSPVIIMEKTHEKLQQLLQQKETGNRYGMDISITVITKKNQEYNLTFGGSKQTLYYTHENKLEELKGSRARIGGVIKNRAKFKETTISLPKGTTLYFSSDGFYEQHDRYENKLGSLGFFELLNNIKEEPLTLQKKKLSKIFKEYQEGVGQRDDVTVIGLKL
jgi:serine phosphatase RsbU (regulator of sigma subunit)